VTSAGALTQPNLRKSLDLPALLDTLPPTEEIDEGLAARSSAMLIRIIPAADYHEDREEWQIPIQTVAKTLGRITALIE